MEAWSWNRLARLGLEEDVGAGDITTELTIPPHRTGRVLVKSRQPLVVCGLPILKAVYDQLSHDVTITLYSQDGENHQTDAVLAEIEGPARALLTGERTALNVLTWLSSIATATQLAVQAVQGLPVTILDTRKTRPGQRLWEKYAVRTGGGTNHRQGLYDAILIKDNHIAAMGGITAAVSHVKQHASHVLFVEAEADMLSQIPLLLAAGVDGILLDNMPLTMLAQAVAMIDHRVFVEASGGIGPDQVRAVAETGVDAVSLGYLTHSAPHVDIGMDWEALS
ncbi:nicotinate-nucleotide diphosphorylase (carboxylating) [Sulfobacillus thermotolerans]|uniref:nicotinate-nucleotide diphosphorylase (carboxylating) n=1 Tax=Sulfobacillus thermotolerans TaxID=338644 RepID=A0ABM6RPM7_9FIRM|nr:nicotinate-nucleotide diphosphorylase (carboxylating) [Sulfobacillus thermotolerans]